MILHRLFVRSLRLSVSISALFAVMSVASPAAAEELLLHAIFGLGTGLEGGDAQGAFKWRRARTRFVAGLDTRWDEGRAHGLSARTFVELERRATIGGELRYTAWASRVVGVFGGGVLTLAPESLFGAGVGAEVAIPLGKTWGLLLEPSVSAFPWGTDKPQDSVIVWGALTIGVRLGL